MGIQPLFHKQKMLLAGAAVLMLFAGGCGRQAVRHPAPAANLVEKKAVPKIGFTIQAGAFANAESGALLARTLQERGLEATYFLAGKFYKVRFGNFPTKELARARAEEIRHGGIIDEFYIVSPEEQPVANRVEKGEVYLREELVRSARSFLGVPYLWGGASPETGFDCSGLTMTVYQLCGLDLPRTSRDQYTAGNPVELSYLEKGDLVFFAPGGDKISHVGIYTGNGQFIHAPERGKKIRTDFLSNGYFSRTYIGARSYL
jgi:hypothetical protein